MECTCSAASPQPTLPLSQHGHCSPSELGKLPQINGLLTEKPVELAARAIQYSSREGENVLDLFGGSGSTLIACEQTGRNAYLMELDLLYADVIVQRWENLTGKKAERKPIDIEATQSDSAAVETQLASEGGTRSGKGRRECSAGT